MNDKLTKVVEKFILIAQERDILFINQKDIPYGVQLEFSQLAEKSKVNIYYSEKKQKFTFTTSNKQTSLNIILNEIYIHIQNSLTPTSISKLHPWNKWIGSDESGKGDYFGPLVVCAFYCQEKNIIDLQRLGVKDSKQLKDNQINIIADKIKERFPRHFNIITLTPQKYNDLYQGFKENNKKLNHLLAWCHAKAIGNLIKNFKPQGIFVDKFSQQNLVEYYLNNDGLDDYDILQAHQGERDIAVATASILARAKFNAGIDYYSKLFGLNLPKGGGNQTIPAGKLFIEKYGEEKLSQVAKLHFKNSEKLI